MADTMSDAFDVPADTLYGVKEIAAFLRIKERTVEHWIKMKRLPVCRMGRTIVARRSRLLEALDATGEQSAE